MTTIGSLCTGYGGLDLAVESVFDARMVWLSEFDKHAAKVCEVRFPGIPNLGDLTTVDWAAVEQVDIVTAGYPCQPFSHAGNRKGTNDERHIWPHIAAAIRVLRPRVVVLENVSGHVSLGLDTVLGDLAALGFDAEWGTVRASDIGAPHRRERLFIVATNRHTDCRAGYWRGETFAHVRSELDEQTTTEPPRVDRPPTDTDSRGLEERTQSDGEPQQPRLESSQRDDTQRRGATTANTAGDGRNQGRAEPEGQQRRPDASVSCDVATDAARKHEGRVSAGTIRQESPASAGSGGSPGIEWGNYAPAIRRWESTIGRAAPNPTTLGRTGRPVLNPPLVEWMMGLPAGWVTDLGLPRSQQLKILGNGVVPQQAAAAIVGLDCDTPGSWLIAPRVEKCHTQMTADRPARNLPRPRQCRGRSSCPEESWPMRGPKPSPLSSGPTNRPSSRQRTGKPDTGPSTVNVNCATPRR